MTVLRPACVANVAASLLTRTAYSSRIRRISSTASSPTRSAPAFSISLRTAAVESSPFRIKITRKEFKIADSIKVCHFLAGEAWKRLLRGLGATFEPLSSTLSCQSEPITAKERSGNVRPCRRLRSFPATVASYCRSSMSTTKSNDPSRLRTTLLHSSREQQNLM